MAGIAVQHPPQRDFGALAVAAVQVVPHGTGYHLAIAAFAGPCAQQPIPVRNAVVQLVGIAAPAPMCLGLAATQRTAVAEVEQIVQTQGVIQAQGSLVFAGVFGSAVVQR